MRRWVGPMLTCLLAIGLWAGVTPLACDAQAPSMHMSRHRQEPFYLKDGDRIVFYGDSITDQRLYTTYIETYCVSRFPRKHFTFIHSGWGGDRVTGGGGGPIDLRLKRDVLVYKPTVVTICLGMNDGGYSAFDQGRFDTYVSGYRHILDTLLKELPGVRITLLTAPAYDDVTRPVGFLGGYNATLTVYGEAVKKLGQEYGLVVADTNAPLVAALARAKTADTELATSIIRDRVHPGHGGHIVMAAAVLKAWNALDTVADMEIDAADKKVVREENTHITGLTVIPTKITFTHLDRALPWPLDRNPDTDKDAILTLAVTDEEQSLNRFVLKISGLSASNYTLKVDGTDVGNVSAADLQRGLDLAALPNLPSNVQARQLLALTRKHNDLHFRRWRQIQVPAAKNGTEVPPDVQKQMDDLDAQDAAAVVEQRAAAQPKPHTVELVPAS